MKEWLENDNDANNNEGKEDESQSQNQNPTGRQQPLKKNKNGITLNDPPPLNKNNICSIILNKMHQTITDMVTETHQNY